MSSDLAISIQNVSKCFKIFDRPQDRLKQTLVGSSRQYYREFWALRNISFDVKKGETVGIIGRNGSGKSTLLQILAGTLSPTEGDVHVQGRVAALLELGSGFNPEFSGRDNVYLNGSILGLSREEVDRLFEEIVEFADIGDHIDQPVKTYSSGMAVRLAFAVQAMVPKDVLIVDEALAVGDELFQRKCFAKIEEFKANGGTILFVSHDGASVVQLCDRALFLDSGEALLYAPSKTVVNLYQKFIYAPHSSRESLRREIQEVAQAFARPRSEMSKASEASSAQEEPVLTEAPGSRESQIEEPMYDPNLIPKETLHYETNGAKIFNPQITTINGKPVNLLLANRSYIWRYQVRFDRSFQNIRFGMLIKTGNGWELGGAVTALPGQGVPEVQAGDVLKVEFTFTPLLNTGTYFLNGGVLALTPDGEMYLDRAIDLAVFKILPREDSLSTAIVNFNPISVVVKSRATDSEQEGRLDS